MKKIITLFTVLCLTSNLLSGQSQFSNSENEISLLDTGSKTAEIIVVGFGGYTGFLAAIGGFAANLVNRDGVNANEIKKRYYSQLRIKPAMTKVDAIVCNRLWKIAIKSSSFKPALSYNEALKNRQISIIRLEKDLFLNLDSIEGTYIVPKAGSLKGLYTGLVNQNGVMVDGCISEIDPNFEFSYIVDANSNSNIKPIFNNISKVISEDKGNVRISNIKKLLVFNGDIKQIGDGDILLDGSHYNGNLVEKGNVLINEKSFISIENNEGKYFAGGMAVVKSLLHGTDGGYITIETIFGENGFVSNSFDTSSGTPGKNYILNTSNTPIPGFSFTGEMIRFLLTDDLKLYANSKSLITPDSRTAHRETSNDFSITVGKDTVINGKFSKTNATEIQTVKDDYLYNNARFVNGQLVKGSVNFRNEVTTKLSDGQSLKTTIMSKALPGTPVMTITQLKLFNSANKEIKLNEGLYQLSAPINNGEIVQIGVVRDNKGALHSLPLKKEWTQEGNKIIKIENGIITAISSQGEENYFNAGYAVKSLFAGDRIKIGQVIDYGYTGSLVTAKNKKGFWEVVSLNNQGVPEGILSDKQIAGFAFNKTKLNGFVFPDQLRITLDRSGDLPSISVDSVKLACKTPSVTDVLTGDYKGIIYLDGSLNGVLKNLNRNEITSPIINSNSNRGLSGMDTKAEDVYHISKIEELGNGFVKYSNIQQIAISGKDIKNLEKAVFLDGSKHNGNTIENGQMQLANGRLISNENGKASTSLIIRGSKNGTIMIRSVYGARGMESSSLDTSKAREDEHYNLDAGSVFMGDLFRNGIFDFTFKDNILSNEITVSNKKGTNVCTTTIYANQVTINGVLAQENAAKNKYEDGEPVIKLIGETYSLNNAHYTDGKLDRGSIDKSTVVRTWLEDNQYIDSKKMQKINSNGEIVKNLGANLYNGISGKVIKSSEKTYKLAYNYVSPSRMVYTNLAVWSKEDGSIAASQLLTSNSTFKKGIATDMLGSKEELKVGYRLNSNGDNIDTAYSVKNNKSLLGNKFGNQKWINAARIEFRDSDIVAIINSSNDGKFTGVSFSNTFDMKGLVTE